jgi:hypothetical protein
MDPQLLDYYNKELVYMREMAGEFAASHPKIARRLGMHGIEVADPYVERLIEAFSFMSARMQIKLDAEFPRFTQRLLEVLYPNYLAPTPSMAVAQLHPSVKEGDFIRGFLRLHDLEHLKASGQRGVLLDVPLVLAPGGGSDGAQGAARQRRLEQVGRIAGAGLAARAHQRVDLIDEQEDRLRGPGSFFQQTFQARLELATHAGTGQQCTHIEAEQAHLLQCRRHLPVCDGQCQALGRRNAV